MCDLWMEPPIDWRLDLAYFREKKGFKFWWPCRSREKDGDPVIRPTKQINKILQLQTQNIEQNGLHKQIHVATANLTLTRYLLAS